jgi:hypothetical protein
VNYHVSGIFTQNLAYNFCSSSCCKQLVQESLRIFFFFYFIKCREECRSQIYYDDNGLFTLWLPYLHIKLRRVYGIKSEHMDVKDTERVEYHIEA